MKTCSVDGCSTKAFCRGLCRRHYKHILQYGEIKRTTFDRNEIKIDGDYATVIINDKFGNFMCCTKIDIEDIEMVKPLKWGIDGSGYAVSRVDGKTTGMHKFLLPGNQEVDHINNDRLDNRKSNLRGATHLQNSKNKKPGKNNKTGYKGVCFKRNRFVAQICVNQKVKHLGYFATPEEAATAYNEAAKTYHGEFAFLNEVSNA